jgi:transitional endoplasmic reticulum ATPase
MKHFDSNNNNNNKVSLRVAETNSKFVGRGMALVDPKVMEEMDLSTGDVLEISGKKKSYALLWSSQRDDHGKKVIRIDGYTRNNIGVGIDDTVSVRKVNVKKAEQVILAPTEELNIVGLEDYLPELLEGRVVTRGDIIPLNIMGRRIGFAVTSTSPTDTASNSLSAPFLRLQRKGFLGCRMRTLVD